LISAGESNAPRAPVVKDSGARATLPPFGEEHEELRGTVARFVTAEIAPHVDEWEAAREFPRDLYRRCAELGFLGLKFRRPTAARAATTCTTRSGSRSWRAPAARAGSRRG
jgi:alkylation response protein AidB-like acyl-CoA dehydrogenase